MDRIDSSLNSTTTDGTAKHEPLVSLIGVVEDEESVRDALYSLIRSAGYDCALFASAEAFLASGHLNNTDCMLLDVRMPGLSGLELQTRLRQMNAGIPIIFITAHVDDDLRSKALRDGAIAVFGKPVNDDALLRAIENALNSPSH